MLCFHQTVGFGVIGNGVLTPGSATCAVLSEDKFSLFSRLSQEAAGLFDEDHLALSFWHLHIFVEFIETALTTLHYLIPFVYFPIFLLR
jgi:hypothetical protein